MRIQARTRTYGQVVGLLGVCALAANGCSQCGGEGKKSGAPAASVSLAPEPPASVAPPASAPPSASAAPSAEVMPEARCPPDMVKVAADARRYCVDRYEAMLVDNATGAPLSPYFAPARKAAVLAFDGWSKKRFEMGSPKAQLIDLPELPKWERITEFEPRAVSKKGVVPNGYTSGVFAALACKNAGKRLCTPAEWRAACGGEQGWKFPYGAEYAAGKCNVFREGHPAVALHDNAAIGHTDPRLNRVKINGKPLLRKTGDSADCASRWGDDAIYDMVGNLDEWMDHDTGTFGGGFFSRGTKDGCDWRTENHPKIYADYSTGVRCCADLPGG